MSAMKARQRTAQLAEVGMDRDVSQISFSALKPKNYRPINLDTLKKLTPDQEAAKRRAAPRFNLELNVFISNGFKIFKTASENVSFTGMLLKDAVPVEFADAVIEIVIKEVESQRVRYLHFKGRMINEGRSTKRLSFKAMTRESEVQLMNLLDMAASV